VIGMEKTKFLYSLSKNEKINTTKENHIVSQLLLQKFWESNTNSLYWNKNNNTKKPKIKKNKFIFKKMFSYQEGLNDATESFLSDIETKMGLVLNKILNYLNTIKINGQTELILFSVLKLSKEEQETLIKFYLSIFYRNIVNKETKKTIEKLRDKNNQELILNEIITERGYGLSKEEIEKIEVVKNEITEANIKNLEQDFNESYLLDIIHNNEFINPILNSLKNAMFIIYSSNKIILSNELYIKNNNDSINFIFPISKNILFQSNTGSIEQNIEEEIFERYTKYIITEGYEYLFYSKSLKNKYFNY